MGYVVTVIHIYIHVWKDGDGEKGRKLGGKFRNLPVAVQILQY